MVGSLTGLKKIGGDKHSSFLSCGDNGKKVFITLTPGMSEGAVPFDPPTLGQKTFSDAAK